MRKHYIQPTSELVTTSLFIQICAGTTLPIHDRPGAGQLTNEVHFNDDEELQLNNQSLWEDK